VNGACLCRSWGGLFGSALEEREGGLWGLLQEFCDQTLPLVEGEGQEAEATACTVQKAALWCWVYLERECHHMAREVTSSLQ